MTSNIGYLYYKEYFTDEIIEECKIQGKKYDEENNPLIKINQNIIENSNIDILKNNKFTFIKEIQDRLYKDKIYFKTTYPGLIVGAGYSHIIKEKEEFKLGLEFDYTTGLPVINGSSIKGMLRSVFYNEKDERGLIEEKEKYIKGILKELISGNNNVENIDFEELTYSIFEGKCKDKDKGKDSEYKYIPINERDIFFGAIIDIEKTSNEMGQRGKYVLGEDYITPHGEGKEKLKNPIPIKFLKAMPNVVWCFGFNLKKFNEEITADVKKKLFEQILLDLGIGAKTNVGYGRLESISN